MAQAVGNARSRVAAGVHAQQQGAVAVRGGKGWAWALGVACLVLTKPSFAQAVEPDAGRLTEPKETVEGLAVEADNDGHRGAEQWRAEVQEEAAKSGQFMTPALVPVGGIRNPYSLNPAPNCDETCERDKKDLQAQKEMARAANWMTFIAGGSLLLSGLGVWLIRDTLKATQDAAKAAHGAVVEAKEGTGAIRKIGEHQLRAYLDISCQTGGFPTFTEAKVFSAVVTVRNTGQTPAYSLSAEAKVIVSSAEHDIRGESFGGSGNKGALGPGQETKLKPVHWSPARLEDLAAMRFESTRIIVTGKVSYKDAFKAQRTAHFRMRLDPITKAMYEEPEGNEADQD